VPLERRIRLLGVRATALTVQGTGEAALPPIPAALPLFD